MMRGLIIITVAILVIATVAYVLTRPQKSQVDTETYSREVAGYYGEGAFVGELLQSDRIRTNVTGEDLSQSIVVQGEVCQRIAGLGKVFLDGSGSTEPDAYYKIYVNGVLQFTSNLEVGSSSALTGCLELARREHVSSGDSTGVVRADLWVYVFSFERGAGQYELLAWDQAVLASE